MSRERETLTKKELKAACARADAAVSEKRAELARAEAGAPELALRHRAALAELEGEAAELAKRLKKITSLKKLARRFVRHRLRPALDRLLVDCSIHGDPVVFDKALFPFTRKLEESYEEIRKEVLALSELRAHLPHFQEVSPYQHRIAHGEQWKTVYLYGFGERARTATELCPVTASLLEQVPNLESACFSMLAPGTHIDAHRGVYKGLVNVHLGVIVPKEADKCWIRVGDETIVWREGECCVFDDTNEHEVWNETGDERVVLFLQVHRDLGSPGRQLSKLFLRALRLTPYLRTPMRNGHRFDETLRQIAVERGLLPRGR